MDDNESPLVTERGASQQVTAGPTEVPASSHNDHNLNEQQRQLTILVFCDAVIKIHAVSMALTLGLRV